MRALLLALPIALFAHAALAGPKAPASAGPGFDVAFPEKPKQETVEQNLTFDYGRDIKLTVQRLSVEQDTGIFVVTYFEIPQSLFEDAELYAKTDAARFASRERTAQQFIQQTVDGVAKSLGGRIEKNANVKRDGAREVAFGGPLVGPDQKTRVGWFEGRTILVGDPKTMKATLYTALAATADEEFDRKRALTFVNSLLLRGEAARALSSAPSKPTPPAPPSVTPARPPPAPRK